MTMDDKDRADLQTAKSLLENPGLAAKITNLIGTLSIRVDNRTKVS